MRRLAWYAYRRKTALSEMETPVRTLPTRVARITLPQRNSQKGRDGRDRGGHRNRPNHGRNSMADCPRGWNADRVPRQQLMHGRLLQPARTNSSGATEQKPVRGRLGELTAHGDCDTRRGEAAWRPSRFSAGWSYAAVNLSCEPEFTLGFEPIFEVMPVFAASFLESAVRSHRDGVLRM